VAVVKAARADLSSDLILTAEFEPFQEIDVMAKVSGYIREIKVDIGDRVKEGQLLATLEIPEMQDDLTRAAAAIEEANAELATARDELQRARNRRTTWRICLTRGFWMSPNARAGPGSAAGSGRGALARSGSRGAGLRRQVAHHGE
jgi:pyruvate/2-oxoglutarate dehydrogenase complex dihydrolipoamide acyltransferase (E2) component